MPKTKPETDSVYVWAKAKRMTGVSTVKKCMDDELSPQRELQGQCYLRGKASLKLPATMLPAMPLAR